MKRFSLLLVPALLALTMFPATVAGARPATDGLLTNVAVSDPAQGFTGTLTITEITRSASGGLLFDGVVTNASGVADAFTDAVGTLSHGGNPLVCDILFLDLGPIFLDVLGLTVDLSRITLDINAVPGAGNLLGNLLCAVAGLLDGGLGGLGGLLDRLLALINDLLG